MISRIFYIFIFILFFFSGKKIIISQYRDPFTVKKTSNKIKKTIKEDFYIQLNHTCQKNKKIRSLT
jgi:hypothetical protein